MEQQIERKIADLANSEAEMLTEQTGISPSLSSDEAKQYVRDVLKEIKARK
jgi:polyhydroxyalkanoate synthesis regulator phasin